MHFIHKASQRLWWNAAQWRRRLLGHTRNYSTTFSVINQFIPHKTRKLYMFKPLLLPSILSLGGKNDFSPNPDVDAEIEDNITHLIILAKLALEKGDKERAEAILDMGLKLCEERNITFGMPFMYDILATIALSNGEIDKAENLLVTIIEKMSKVGASEDDHHIVDFKLRLARIYSAFREYDLAEIGFKSCLEAQKQKIIEGDISTKTGMLYVNILFWYGIHKIRNNYFLSAKKLLDTAYDYSGKIKGLSPYQEMVILYTLADLNMELGEMDIALVNMQNAVMLGKGIGSTDLPRCYVKLAKIYHKMKVDDQARFAVEEGVKLAKIFNHFDVLQDGHELLAELNKNKIDSPKMPNMDDPANIMS
ncbi:tetratricopeptide repeat protein 19, mitochondrial-like [Atheta coriaria]|uniref:tetratricopeptide repeat protein 19, mitochondrial-like n=1 Tax=Dalotia coriaria TaxID=877792 RepID=UPI0031F366A1